MTSVLNTILDTTDANLIDELQTLVDDSDPAKAGLVRTGQLQDDPTDAGINVLTMMHDHANPEGWMNSVIGGQGQQLTGLDWPIREIGGGESWFRRYTTELQLFWPTSFERDDARTWAHEILSRAEYAIKSTQIDPTPDDYGEIWMQTNLVYSRVIEQGGPGQFIWRGKIFWCAITEKP